MGFSRAKHLIMHVDSQVVPQRPFLKGLPLPEATNTFTPVAHEDFDNLVQQAISDAGIKIKQSEYGLSNTDSDGYQHKFFVAHDTVDEVTGGVNMVIGARSSTDKSFAAGLVFGQRVTICDNRAFSGEYVLRRKHTRHILRDLPKMIAAGMGTYFQQAELQAKLIESLKDEDVNRYCLHDTLIGAAERTIIPWADIPKIKSHFYEPTDGNKFEETGWGLHNAFTYHLTNKYTQGSSIDRSLRMSGLFRSTFAPELDREYEELKTQSEEDREELRALNAPWN
tara:strand:- start:20129 stop:20971 length:843 start_codon:yes stop_codon:yes gene_type:complete